MSKNYQVASLPLPGDEPYQNYSSTLDIADKIVVALDVTNGVNGTIKGDAPGIVAPTLNQSPVPLCFGVTMEKIAKASASGQAGAIGGVRTAGRAVCIANGTITAGDVVGPSVDSAKLGWVKTNSSGVAFGIALDSAADGEDVLIKILPSRNS